VTDGPPRGLRESLEGIDPMEALCSAVRSGGGPEEDRASRRLAAPDVNDGCYSTGDTASEGTLL
jgi:hypothetical protein